MNGTSWWHAQLPLGLVCVGGTKIRNPRWGCTYCDILVNSVSIEPLFMANFPIMSQVWESEKYTLLYFRNQ